MLGMNQDEIETEIGVSKQFARKKKLVFIMEEAAGSKEALLLYCALLCFTAFLCFAVLHCALLYFAVLHCALLCFTVLCCSGGKCN